MVVAVRRVRRQRTRAVCVLRDHGSAAWNDPFRGTRRREVHHAPAVDLQHDLPLVGVADQRLARIRHLLYLALALSDVAALSEKNFCESMTEVVI